MKKRFNVFLLILILFFLLRFILCHYGITTENTYIFSRELFFGINIGVYRFFAKGIPFFGITVGKTLSATAKYLLPAPIISADCAYGSITLTDGVLFTLCVVLLIAVNRKKRTVPYEEECEVCEEDTAENPVEKEPAEKEDKSLCPKCGSRIFGDNLYCENCGAKRKE